MPSSSQVFELIDVEDAAMASASRRAVNTGAPAPGRRSHRLSPPPVSVTPRGTWMNEPGSPPWATGVGFAPLGSPPVR